MRRVLVIGGGIIGLTIALARLRAGDSVVVVDSAESGRASPASAGMLSIHHMESYVKKTVARPNATLERAMGRFGKRAGGD